MADDPVQSALHPAGPAAEAIADLWWLMFWICTAITVLVVVLLIAGLMRRRRSAQPTAPLGNRFIAISGIIVPAVVLVVLLIANLRTTIALRSDDPALTIRVVGHQWWWEVHYPEHGIIDANEIRIPAGRTVRLELQSADVIHSFWVPRLAGKTDLIPGMTTRMTIRADEPGEFRGQCAEFCGLQHALMAFYVVAMPAEQFDRWAAEASTPPVQPTDERLLRGRQIFARAACGNCHTVRGTEFTGKIGPDLTHMGSRLTIGAGTIPNNRGNLEGWISNPQPLKPGNLMPPSYLSSDELHAVTDYVESLR